MTYSPPLFANIFSSYPHRDCTQAAGVLARLRPGK
jgi:hypothetical protein